MGQSDRVSLVSRWGEHGERPEPLATNDSLFGLFTVSASVDVACDPVTAWRLVTDVHRIGEFSPECVNAEWIDGSSGPVVGARFEGTNRMVVNPEKGDDYVWIRPCTVTASSCPDRFSYTVGDRFDGTPATEWDFFIDATPTGCRITQQFRHLPRGLSGIRGLADAEPVRAEEIVGDRTRDLNTGITATLDRMKAALEDAP